MASTKFMSSFGLTFVYNLCLVSGTGCLISLNLNGNWTVTNGGNVTVSGIVPGSMYTAMMSNNIIKDPYYRKNDAEYKWISRDDWTYSRHFQVSMAVLSMKSVVLVCEGLDTISKIYVNGHLVGRSDNMFVRYVFNIKQFLKAGDNHISVEFQSAVNFALQRAKSYPYRVPLECPYAEYKGDCHVNMLRKSQCSFSWDWGPSFPTQGIWRDIYIESFNSAVIRDVTVATTKNKDGTWNVDVGVFMDIGTNTGVTGEIELRLGNTMITQNASVSFTPDKQDVTITLKDPKTSLLKEWWPNGHGNQTLYTLYVFFTSTNNNEVCAKKVKIGFRTVDLVQEYVSTNKSHGRTFYFRLNGRPVFLKGSNWIPADSFQERVTKKKIDELLESASYVHMNSLRICGIGVYESDYFYQKADELGIMIWQDFMFACAMYPVDQPFLDSVTKEIIHNIRRLKHHPSIIIWSGNNENEKALRQNWYNTDVNYTLYFNDYIKLYKDVISSIVNKEDTSRPFIPSSPSNGVETLHENWVSKTPWSELYGDIHDYRYLDPFYDHSVYRIPRMASEYGLQSYPSYESLEEVYAPEDMDYWSDMNDYRQHHPNGNMELLAEMIMYLNLPNATDKKQRFKDLIYATQIDQAVGVKTETEHYRRWQNNRDNTGRGNTMGAMYWQLNDIWQAPTWASIEYGGKWKMLHYYARHFFAPVLISPYLDGDFVDVFLCVDEVSVSEVRHPVTHDLSFHLKSPNKNKFSGWFPHKSSNKVPSADVQMERFPHKSSNDVLSPVGEKEQFPHKSSNDLITPRLEMEQSTGSSGVLYVRMYSWDNMTFLHEWKINYTVGTTAESVFRQNVNEMMKEAGCIGSKNCFLYFHLGDVNTGPVAWLPLTVFRDVIGLRKTGIQIATVEPVQKGLVWNVGITTNAIAPFVWLDVEGVKGYFSDNGFLMVTGKKIVTFYAYEPTDSNIFTKGLHVRSLQDIYY